MREWPSGEDRTTTRVFVVAAVVWFIVSGALPFLGLFLYLGNEVLWDRLPSAVQDGWAVSFLIAMLQLAPLMLIEVFGLSVGEMVFSGLMYPYSPTYIFLATYSAGCALLWATLIAAAFVLARRSRERRAASRGV